MDHLKNLELFHEIDEKFKKIIQESFEGIPILSQGQAGPVFRADIPHKNGHFVNSNYFYRGPFEFFHLTSIEKLFSILNSRAIRFYNLYSSQDPDEYKYAGEVLKLSEQQIEHSMEYLYTFSCCPISEINNQHVWNTYGINMKGAAIIFTIENDSRLWDNFHISQVNYHPLDNFDTYLKRIQILEAEYGITAFCDLSRLMAFHKKPKWNNEKEVRIVTYFPFDTYEEYLKFTKTEFRLQERNRITQYFELPIWVNNSSTWLKSYSSPDLDRTRNLIPDYFESRPKIKIKKIVLGNKCGISPAEFETFRTKLIEIVRYNYGYDIEIDDNLYEIQ